MWARSHTSGLISESWTASIAASPNGAQIASVRSRASASAPARVSASTRVTGNGVPIFPKRYDPPVSGGRRSADPRLAPDLDHLAHGRGAVGDPGVQRPDRELEAARLELLEL